MPLDTRALVRVTDTPSQAARPAAARAALARAFAARASLVTDRSILLVDDVYTTGATTSDAARTLLEAGAARVDLAVLLLAGETATR
jgi:predicted amidophosphoribosyltransferase